MKFQNCILINFERKQGRTDGCTDNPKAICHLNFSKVGGIKTYVPHPLLGDIAI